MSLKIPEYFKNSYEYVEKTVKNLKKGKVRVGCKTPGGRNVYVVEYGEPNKYERKATYSSALGSGDITCYADKEHPVMLLIGCVHGAEFEGTAAILNLISLLETGRDLRGDENKKLLDIMEKSHMIFVPCANPDGRARVPFEGFGGETHETLRYYNQGTWADGSLCGWPGCKRVHPIKGVEHLGGYFNDDGINLMHDNFFEPYAEETKLLLHLAGEYAPDVILNLHGAAEMGYGMYGVGCAADDDLKEMLAFEARMCEAFTQRGWRYINTNCSNSKPSFNLTEAMYFCCGGLSVTWESYQGVLAYEGEVIPDNVYDTLLDTHFVFFEEAFNLAEKKYL